MLCEPVNIEYWGGTHLYWGGGGQVPDKEFCDKFHTKIDKNRSRKPKKAKK